MRQQKRPIAVFDSGMGGVSVLRKLYRIMPNEDYLFFGDSKYAPYGTKKTQEVRERTLECVKYFREQNAKAVVIACNTATSAAISAIRELYPDLPVIGLEPAVKPAALENPGEDILVMATPYTLRKEKFLNLVSLYEDVAHIHMLPAPGIVEFVEKGMSDSEELQQYLREILGPYREKNIKGIVLGCTHFPFVKRQIAKIMGEDVKFYDGGIGAARETKRQLAEKRLLNDVYYQGRVKFENSDPSAAHIELSEKLFFQS